MFRRSLQYLVKWEGYGVEGNTWEYSENVDNAQEKVAEFHQRNPATPHCICAIASAWKSSPKTAKRPGLDQTRTDQDRK